MNKRNIINSIKEDNFLDFITGNRHLIEKDELITIITELYIEIHSQTTPPQRRRMTENIINELEERL